MAAGTKKRGITRGILAKLDRAIAEADFSKIPPDRLLSLRLQYVEAVKEDDAPTRKMMDGGSVEEVMVAYTELLNDIRAGRITTEQAAKENAVLSGMIKAIEATQLKARIEEIERILASE